MGFEIGIVLVIFTGVIGFLIFNSKQKRELDSLKKENAKLSADLDETKRGKANLENQLEKADIQIYTLESESTEKTTQIDILTNQLKTVSESNANALKVLHLFELSLQLNAFVLYSEVSRATYLGEKYKELYEEYEEFLEEVEKRAKRRLVRTGIGTALSLIPGAGILQLAGDLVELADFASTVVEGTTDFEDVLGAVSSSLDVINSLGEFINLSETEVLLSEISSDQDRKKVIQEYQSIFQKVFEQNQGQDIKEPDASDFDNFLKAVIQQMKEFVDSMPESERRNALNRIVGNFGQFGIRLSPYDESPKIRGDRSLLLKTEPTLSRKDLIEALARVCKMASALSSSK